MLGGFGSRVVVPNSSRSSSLDSVVSGDAGLCRGNRERRVPSRFADFKLR